MVKILFVCHGKIQAEDDTPSYATLYHGLQGFLAIHTTGILLLKITIFCPQHDTKQHSRLHHGGGCFLLATIYSRLSG